MKEIQKEKQKWREDKDFLDQNPHLNTQAKRDTMNLVKEKIEKRIDELNAGIEKLKGNQSQSVLVKDEFSTDVAFKMRWKHLFE